MTESPLQACLQKLEVSRRLLKWSIELSEFEIEYVPRIIVKAQVLADFIAEFTPAESHEDETGEDVIPMEEPKSILNPSSWEMYVDGALRINSQGIDVVLISPGGVIIKRSILVDFDATNNHVEYESLITGLQLAQGLGVSNLIVNSDS